MPNNYLLSKQEEDTLKIIELPAQSHDLNLIKLLWDKLDHQVGKHFVRNILKYVEKDMEAA